MPCRDCELIEAELIYNEAEIIYWSLMEALAYEAKYAAQQTGLALNIEWAECCSEPTLMAHPVSAMPPALPDMSRVTQLSAAVELADAHRKRAQSYVEKLKAGLTSKA